MPTSPLPCKTFLCAHWIPCSMANQSPLFFTFSQKALSSSYTSLRPGRSLKMMTFCSLIHVCQQIKPGGGVSVFTPPLCLKTITFLQCHSFGAHTIWFTSFPIFLCLPTPAILLESSHCRGRTLPCHALPYILNDTDLPSKSITHCHSHSIYLVTAILWHSLSAL